MNTQNTGLTVTEGNYKWNITHTETSITVTQKTSGKIDTICIPIGQKSLLKVSKAIVAFAKFMKATGFFHKPCIVYSHPDGWDIQVGSGLLRVTDDCGDYINVPMVRKSLQVLGKMLLDNHSVSKEKVAPR